MGATAQYAILQALYWSTFCTMFNYASPYLADKGLSSSLIGLVLGSSYALSALVQALFPALVARLKLQLTRVMGLIFTLIALLAVALFFRGESFLIYLLPILIFTLHSAMQPSVNALQLSIQAEGKGPDFGLARGIGSASYALVSVLLGQLFGTLSIAWLPIFYLVTLIPLAWLLLRRDDGSDPVPVERGKVRVLDNRPFRLFLLGLIFLSSAHIFIDNFMFQIMENVGGGSEELGIAIGIAAIMELPAMALYSRIRRRVHCARLLMLSGLMWTLKHLMILLARDPVSVCMAEILQFAAYALYVPTGVEFVALVLPPSAYYRGQALLGTAFTLGSLAATLLGGRIQDLLGMHSALMAMEGATILGAALFIAAGVTALSADA